MKYMKADMELVEFEAEDIILTSGGTDIDDSQIELGGDED